MKTICKLSAFVFLVFTGLGCSEESDLAIKRVVAPVVIEVEDVSGTQLQATFFELDKSGILDYTAGIDSLVVPNLSVEVFASGSLLGVFTTDTNGSFLVDYSAEKPNEFAGSYNGIAFRIKK